MGVSVMHKFFVDKTKFYSALPFIKNLKRYPVKIGYLKENEYVIISGYELYNILRIFDPNGTTYSKPEAKLVTDKSEKEITLNEAYEIFDKCENIIHKERYELDINDVLWIVDIFMLNNDGINIGEVYINDFDKPEWVLDEITNKQYDNVSLAYQPKNLSARDIKRDCKNCPKHNNCSKKNV